MGIVCYIFLFHHVLKTEDVKICAQLFRSLELAMQCNGFSFVNEGG